MMDDFFSLPILTSILAAPALAGIIFLLIPVRLKFLGYLLGIFSLVFSISLLFYATGITISGDNFRSVSEFHDWNPFLGARYILLLDPLSFCFVAISLLVTLICILERFLKNSQESHQYIPGVLFLTFASVGMFLAGDLLLLFVFFAISMVALIFSTQPVPADKRSASGPVILNLISSVTILLGIVMLYHSINSSSSFFTLEITKLQLIGTPLKYQTWAFACLTIGLLIRAALFPFHGWLNELLTHSSLPVRIVTLTIYTKSAFYLFIRLVIPLTPDVTMKHTPILLFAGLISLLYGGMIAWQQREIRRFFNFSSLSFSGLLCLGIFSLNHNALSGSLILTFGYMLILPVLLIVLTRITDSIGSDLLIDLSGIGRNIAPYGFFLIMSGLAYLGMPGLINFTGLFLLLSGLLVLHPVWSIAALIGVLLLAAGITHVFQNLFSRTDSEMKVDAIYNREWIILIPLLALVLWFGIQPQFLYQTIQQPVNFIDNIVQSHRILDNSNTPSTSPFIKSSKLPSPRDLRP